MFLEYTVFTQTCNCRFRLQIEHSSSELGVGLTSVSSLNNIQKSHKVARAGIYMSKLAHFKNCKGRTCAMKRSLTLKRNKTFASIKKYPCYFRVSKYVFK